MSSQIRKAVARVLERDPASLAIIAPIKHASILHAMDSFEGPIVVSRTAVVSVLQGLAQGLFPPELVQPWASLVRRGYIAGPDSGPGRPLDVDFEEDRECATVEAITSLDEIRDIIDGEVSAAGALELIRLLEEP